MPPQHNMNPVDAIIALLALAMGPTAASVIGPHAAIIAASTAGACWSVGRRESTIKASALWFFFKCNMTAFTVAAGAAVIAESWAGPDTRYWTAAPIAFAIGAVGDNWPKIWDKVFNVVLRAFGKRISGDEQR
jgi:hypothetical protein